MNDLDLPLLTLDATAQAAAVDRGELSPADLVEAALARIERLNPAVNALFAFDPGLARQRAPRAGGGGPFAGVPTLLKDLLAYPGLPAQFGSRLLAGHVAPAGSPYTDALDAAGLVVIGKTATSEFGLLGTTEPLVNGPTRNPWDLERSAGGSSGGSAAAVAAGIVPVAHASDGGGSIRGPASFCGVFGFKPSRDRTASVGLPPGMPTASLLSDHCVSRTVRDSATWLCATEADATADALPSAEALAATPPARLRIGWYRRDVFGGLPDDNALAALDETVALCAALGHEVVECDGPEVGGSTTADAFHDLTALVVAGMTGQMAAAMGSAYDADRLEPYTRHLLGRAAELPADRPAEAVAALADAGERAAAALNAYDALLSPTVPFAAFPLGRYAPTADPAILRDHVNRVAAYTVVASLAGGCAMSVPLHWTAAGLPMGSHFAAPRGADARLLRLAFQLERAAPWIDRLNGLSRSLACPSD